MTERCADCIAFLDFDGVAHPDPCEVGPAFRAQLPLIEAVLRRFDACRIVMSSSWRVVHPLDEMRGYFAVDMQLARHRHDSGASRLAWRAGPRTQLFATVGVRSLAAQRVASGCLSDRRLDSPWIAIDDRDDWFRPGCTNLLATHSRTGFTPDDALRLERMLRERMP